MKIVRIAVFNAVVVIAACSSSSGVLKVGPDTFTISTSASPGKGGVPAAKRIAYKDASQECMKHGELKLFVLSEKSASPSWTEGMANFELNFRCLQENDSEFKRQNLQSTPDRVIETRNR
jgi:hypothetical protein